MLAHTEDIITPEQAGSLSGLLNERIRRTPHAPAYRFYDAMNGVWMDCSWHDMGNQVLRWQSALLREGFEPGERVAIMARNSRFWVIFDQAALAAGLVVVPLYTEDRVDNVHYVLEDANVRLLLIGGQEQWDCLKGDLAGLPQLVRIVSIAPVENGGDPRLTCLQDWLPEQPGPVRAFRHDMNALATIVYTSGTTGQPKGVMLSHKNILSNAYNSAQTMPIDSSEVFLSFLPLSHTLERTIGYYVPMMVGCTVAHARGIPELAKDLLAVKPTLLISVPRIYERVYARIRDNLVSKGAKERFIFNLTVAVGWRRFLYQQGRAWPHPLTFLWPLLKRLVADQITQRFGGRLKAAISGGAALSPDVARIFIGLGVPLLQGYGLTEASPVISVNRLNDNIPDSIGRALPGVEVKVGEDNELLARGDNIMLGFWNNPEETARVLDQEGWLHTGDKARIEDGHIYITGRIKDIIVMANGEKISPADMELAIQADPLFDQVVLIGEARPFLGALAVVNKAQWQKFAADNNLSNTEDDKAVEQALLRRIAGCVKAFPGYAQVRRVIRVEEPWTVENGMLTPTLKHRRSRILERHQAEIKKMYEGH